MKKRVISWLLCLALCLSMLPMAVLAEDVQAPEGPAPSMNEPQPEPRAKENETPAPEPEKKVQSELMTAEKLLMPLSLGDENSPFSSISIVVSQNGTDIGDEDQGILNKSVTLYGKLICKDADQKGAIIKDSAISLKVDDEDFKSGSGGTTNPSEILVNARDLTPVKEKYTITLSITYGEYSEKITRDLTFKKCPHPDIKNENTCSQCGAALVAELTAGASSSATYYETLTEALDAAKEADSGSTVTLLADCSLGNYELRKGSFMLDLDGHKLTQRGNPLWVSGTANLTVKNDRSGADYNGRFYLQSKTATLSLTIGSKYAKIMSDSSVGYILGPDMRYKIETNWVTLGQLYSTTIENVTVERAPFSTSDITVTPEDTYVNRKVTLSVTLDGLADGSEATCEYSVKTSASSGTTNSEGLGSFTLDTNRTFTTDYTPKVSECTICAQIKYRDFYVIKKLEKTFKTCAHNYLDVDQNTGYCRKCKSQMAASVSPSALVGQRTYYETFDLAMNAAWDMLKSKDCWFTMFQDATVGGALNNEYVTGGHTLYMVMNGKTLTSSGTVFSVPKDRWKLNFRAVGDSPGGTLIGESRDWGTIYVQYGGSLEIGSGKYTIQNTYSDTAASIVVHGSYGTYYTPGIATIYASEDSDLGNLLIMSGQVTVHGGTFKNATVSSPGGRLTVSSGRFTGNVIVNQNAWFYAGSSQAYFDGTVTINSDGGATLDGGNYKHLKVDGGRTLGSFMPNTLDMFKMGDVYLPHARNEAELTAGKDEYITIVRHTQHNYDDKGICSICKTQAEAKLYPEDGNYNKYEYGTIWQMLEKAQNTSGSCLVLLRDITLSSNTTISEGNFALSLGGKRLRCANSENQIALVISGGEISIKDGTFDRLKVTDDGKLTLNGGKYYAIDVTDSTYANYGKLLATNRAFKHQTNWESKASITNKSFDVTSTNAPKSVEKPPFDSVAVTPTIWTVDYGKPVTFTATVTSDDSSKALSYQWYTVASDGTKTAIEGETGEAMTVNEAIGSYRYKCEVTCEDYTLSSNTVQLTVQRIDLSGAALSATIAERAYDGSASATVTASSIGSSSLTAGTDYTISAEFEDANAGGGKKVTVTVKLTNPNYCFGYDANKHPIMENTFETTGTITKNTDSRKPISVDENIYNSAAHTYKFDLDSYLTAIKDDLGTMSYGMPEPNNSLQRGIGTPILEGHTLKLPVIAIRWASETSLGRITIPVNSQNYANVSIEICLKLVERTTVTASATPSKSELTYGEKLGTITLSGTTDPMIPGTFAWQTPDAILDAGTYKDLVWKFIPVDYTYAEASGTAEIIVKQAKLTDPAPVTLTIYNGWAGTYEAALPELPALAEGLYFGKNTAYGEPDVSAGGYYSSGAELKTVNGKQGVSIPILKNETAKEGKVGTITVQYTSQNYKPVTLAINLVAKNRTAPTFILTADHDTLSGGGKVTLTLERGNLPDGAVVTVSGTDEAGNAVTLTDNGNGTYSATLPNKTQTYTFIAAYDGIQTIAPKTDFTTVKVQQRSSGGGEPAKPSFPVKISNSGDGVAKVDKSYASAGAKVTITVTPGRNATVQRITVTDEDGERLKLTENRDGTYSFTMPSGTVNVYVRFSGSGLPFADIPSGSWYYDDVAYVYDTGLMTGLTATTFGPNLSTTRGMIVTILWRMENEPAAKHGCPFADVRRGSYYEQAIAWASENGIVTGFDASTFAPDRAITREQLAAILFRFAAYRGMDAVTLRENLSSFQDQAAISAYAVSALNWAVGEGLMQGTGDKLEPTGNATRAQVAAMLRRFMQRNF